MHAGSYQTFGKFRLTFRMANDGVDDVLPSLPCCGVLSAKESTIPSLRVGFTATFWSARSQRS